MNYVEKIIECKMRDIKRMPMRSNRASMLGHYTPETGGCVRRGVLERTRWEEKEMPDGRLALIFQEGHNQEAIVLRDLAEAGIQVIEQQTAFEIKEQELTGHLDGVVLEDGKAVPLEIKSMSPHIYDSVQTFDDFKKKPWTRAYMMQIMVYMLNKGHDRAIFILKNKSTGGLKQVECGLDYDLAEAGLKVCEQINAHIKAGTLPERIKEVETCKDCPMKIPCGAGITLGVELKIGDDPMFVARLDKHFELKEKRDEYDANYDIIKSRVKASAGDKPIKMLCGKYSIEGKPDSRGAFRFSIEVV